MTSAIQQPNLTESLSLIGWRLKRDAEIQERKNEVNFECDVEPTSTSYAASVVDDDYNLDLCLEVDSIDINASSQDASDDYDPYEVFMRLNTRRTGTGRDRAPLAILPSQTPTSSPLVSNYRNYNFAEDDTPVKYPLAIGLIDRRIKQQPQPQPSIHARQNNVSGIRRPMPTPSTSLKRVTFRQSDDEFDLDDNNNDPLNNDARRPNKLPKRTAVRIAAQRFRSHHERSSSTADDDLDDDIAPTVTEMDMLDDDEDGDGSEPITKSMSSPIKPPPPSSLSSNRSATSKSSYIGNMLPSFYEQLPESKKMLLQDATVDSSSKNANVGGEEIVDEENRLQFRTTAPVRGYKRANHLQGTKRYYGNEDDDNEQNQQQSKKRNQDYPQHRNSQMHYRRTDDDYDEDYDVSQDTSQEDEYQQTVRAPARRGRPPSQQHQEDPMKKSARLIAQFEEQHGMKLGDMRVYAPKLRLRISSVNVNWINLPPMPKFPHKVHHS